jgi:hypothetical protein
MRELSCEAGSEMTRLGLGAVLLVASTPTDTFKFFLKIMKRLRENENEKR